MIGKRYWSTGIRLNYSGDRDPAWGGELDYYDEGFNDDEPEQGMISTNGHLRTRYYVPTRGGHRDALATVTDTLKRDAEQLGIEFRDPMIYAAGDGDDPDCPMPPGWIDLLEEEAERHGWGIPTYRETAVDTVHRPPLRVLD